VGEIDFKAISAPENSNKFQKTRFWKEKSVENVVTLGPMAQATLAGFEFPLQPHSRSLLGVMRSLKGSKVLGKALGRVHSQKKGPMSSPRFENILIWWPLKNKVKVSMNLKTISKPTRHNKREVGLSFGGVIELSVK